MPLLSDSKGYQSVRALRLSAMPKAAWEKKGAQTLLPESGMFSPTYLILKFKGSMVSHLLLMLV